MQLGSIGKTVYKSVELSVNQLDGKTWLAMGNHFEAVYLIALSPDFRYRRGTTGNVHVFLLPQIPTLLGSVLFWFMASGLSLGLTWRKGIDVWTLSEPFSGLCALPLRVFTRVAVVFQMQAELLNLPAERFSWFRRYLIGLTTRLVAHLSHRVRAVSQRVASQAIRSGIPAGKVRVVPSRCDTSVFDPRRFQDERTIIREELGLRPEEFLVVFVGRLVLSKGVTYILQAAAQLARTRADFRVLIIGGGELRADLEKEATRLGILGSVVFLGTVPYSRVPAYLAAGDVFLSPSIDEGMPRAVLEALSMGLPVVVTDVGGNSEILSGAPCGYLVPPRDVPGLVSALNAILQDSPARLRMGLAGRRLVIERYDFYLQIRALAEAHYVFAGPGARANL